MKAIDYSQCVKVERLDGSGPHVWAVEMLDRSVLLTREILILNQAKRLKHYYNYDGTTKLVNMKS